MKLRLLIMSTLVAVLSGCGGNTNTTDQPNSEKGDSAALGDTVKKVETTHKGNRYVNERFRFSVTVPADFVAEPDPENGDGRSYKRGDASIIAYAGYAGSFDEVLAFGGNPNDTYNAHNENWAVWSGKEDGRVYYKKTVFKDGIAYSVYFLYPESEKNEFDGIINSVLDSWQTGLPKE